MHNYAEIPTCFLANEANEADCWSAAAFIATFDYHKAWWQCIAAGRGLTGKLEKLAMRRRVNRGRITTSRVVVAISDLFTFLITAYPENDQTPS